MVEIPAERPAADDPRTKQLKANLAAVRSRVSDACQRAGRPLDEVLLVGVTKYVSAADTARLLACGVCDLGESRPQLLWDKAAALADCQPRPRWHMIGHLQRNKLRRTLPLVSLVHSLDSLRLAEAVAGEAAKTGQPCEALIEVNLTDDPGRSGVSFAELTPLAETVAANEWIRLVGLMGMAAKPEGSLDSPREQFAKLREARDQLAGLFTDSTLRPPAPPSLPAGRPARRPGELSLGMSGDFEDAILEGSTIVRIGSVLWEGLREDAPR